MAYNIIKHRRGTTDDWLRLDLVPAEGELVIEECLDGMRKCKIGNGVDRFTKLPYLADDVKETALRYIDRVKQQLDASLSSSEADLAKKLDEAKQALLKVIKDSADAVNIAFTVADAETLATAKEYVDARIAAIDVSIAPELLESVTSELKTELGQQAEELRTEISTAETNAKTFAAGEIAKATDVLNNNIEAASANLQQTINNEIAAIKTDVADIETDLTSAKESVATAISETEKAVLQTLDGSVATLRQEYQAADKKISDSIVAVNADLVNKIDTAVKNTTAAIDEIDSKLSSDYKELINLAETAAKTHADEADIKLSDRITTAEAAIRTNAANTINHAVAISNIAADVEALEDAGAKLLEKVNTLISTHTADLQGVQEDLQELLSVVNELGGQDDTIYEYVNTQTDGLSTRINSLSTSLTGHITSNNTAFNRINTTLNTLATVVATSDADLSDRITELQETLNEKWQELHDADTAQTTALAEAVSQLNSTIRSNVSILNEELRQHGQQLSDLDYNISVKHRASLLAVQDLEKRAFAKDSAMESSISEVATRIDGVYTDIDATRAEIEVQAKRISNIASLPYGSTMGDAELQDIRVGYDNLVHKSAGDAVRQIGKDLDDLKSSLPDYIPASAIDGLYYEDNMLYLTSKGQHLDANGEPLYEPAEVIGGSGGGGGSISTVKLTDLSSANVTVALGKEVSIQFRYTSTEEGVPVDGEGTANFYINNKKVAELACAVTHNELKVVDVTKYLKEGSNTVKVTCNDPNGAMRSAVFNISVVDLKIESTFNSFVTYDGPIVFRYKVHGLIEKTAHVLLDGKEVSSVNLNANTTGRETTYTIAKQAHGCHKITAYVTAMVGTNEITSNILEFEIVCIETGKESAMLASTYSVKKVTQGDLIEIPYQVYDPNNPDCTVELLTYSELGGERILEYTTSATVGRGQQVWKTRKYPAPKSVFVIKYSYELYEEPIVLTREHVVEVEALSVDVSAETDSLQLSLAAAGRLNSETNKNKWEFKTAATADTPSKTITTTFKNFNWVSNGWVTDANGDTCLRLSGDARAIVNFKIFEEDFKALGKTIEFEFAVRDVHSRDTIVIDCLHVFDEDDEIVATNERGFAATPDTAYLKSSGTEVSCNYKDEERIRIAVTVEDMGSVSKFVSIYIDGVLSGVQRYETDTFSQQNPVNIRLGSNDCCLDLYSIRVYNKALSHEEILNNYIADQADPAVKLQLVTENSVIDPITKQVSYDRLKALKQIPIVTFTGPMPTFKGDKKKDTTWMRFEDPAHPELDFNVLLSQIDVQGTSSQFYVRKNWKVKLPEKRQHMPGAIPAKVFCIKVDYAEATGTHNTGSANYIETLYDRSKVTLPPQKDDTRVRTTIQGFPIVIFEKETEDSEPVFSSKGNFNYDKDAENAFGFSEDYYKSYGVECWEFCNNTSNACNFAGEIVDEWSEDFEPRYVPESYKFERIEKLLELKADAEAENATVTMTQAEYAELANLQRDCIKNFKEMHDWVRSTATYELVPDETDTSGKRMKRVALPADEAAARLLKFKNEFANYFNMHYASVYYVFTFVALMMDQRAKNLFLTRWKDSDGRYRWYPYFYDNDTIFGINNEGALVFDYYHEDTDQVGSSNVFNGQNSVLWNNFRECFGSEIKATYAALRSKGADNSPPKLSYDKLIEAYVTKGSDCWSASVYNADAEYKYVSMARELKEDGTVDTSNLYQVRGTGEQHLRYFVANRIKYCDSKWYAGDYPSNDIFLRIYTPSPAEIKAEMTDEEKAATIANNAKIAASISAVPPNAEIKITPFSDMYAGVRYKSGNLQQKRAKAGVETKFNPTDTSETFSDTETAIYGASEISSLGDLSALYCGVINLSNANKLVELTIGNANPAYYNDNFREIHVGANRLLKSIDLRNCAGLGVAGEPQKTLALSGCPNIETIYTEGTNLSAVDLPESGYIKTLHLPSSISTISIKNQPNLTDFSVANNNYSNVRTLRIEDCPTLDTGDMLAKCQVSPGVYSVEHVRLSGVNWEYDDSSFIKSLFPRVDALNNLIGGIRGIDERNIPTDDAYLKGTCKIKNLSGEDYAEIKEHYPDLTLRFDSMTAVLTFKRPKITLVNAATGEFVHDGYEETTVTVDSTNSVLPNFSGSAPVATWPENDAFTYEHVGWSRVEQPYLGVDDNEDSYNEYLQKDAMRSITGARTIYPVFKAIRKSYTVRFFNPTAATGSQLITSVEAPYGSTVKFNELPNITTPIKLDTASPELWPHKGWKPDPSPVLGDMDCIAQFVFTFGEQMIVPLSDISEYKDYWGNDQMGYSLNEADKTMAITSCQNKWSVALKVPETYDVNGVDYTVTSLGGFADCHSLEMFSIPDTVTALTSRALYNCYKLFEITLPPYLTSIGMYALQGCSRLTTVKLPATVTSIGDAAFADCRGLQTLDVSENPNYTVEDGCLIDLRTKTLIQGGIGVCTIPSADLVESLRQYCFSNTKIETAVIPETVKMIPGNAFSRCEQLKTLVLHDNITELDATCFAWCYSLEEVDLPEKLSVIKTYVFNGCALKKLDIPASVSSMLERSFGDLTQLTEVRFHEQRVDGNVHIPYIHEAAFADSGAATGLTFYLPMSWKDHIGNIPWGARNATIEYYNEEVGTDV